MCAKEIKSVFHHCGITHLALSVLTSDIICANFLQILQRCEKANNLMGSLSEFFLTDRSPAISWLNIWHLFILPQSAEA